MRLVVLGAGGIVGRALVAEAARRDWQVAPLSRRDLDVTDEAAVRAALVARRPEVVINCAALTRVDDCETEVEAAGRVNDRAVGGVVAACAASGARLVHLSTDYVFDGRAESPYAESAPTSPLSVYGRTKLAGEQRALADERSLVVRTSAVFGVGGPNFVDAIAGRIRRREGPVRVVDDQVTTPTWAPFLARAVADLGESAATGLWHYRNREPVSWFEFARAIRAELGSDLEIVPVTTAEFPRPARRPARSVLAVDRFEAMSGRRVETWAEGLGMHLAAAAGEKR